MQLIVEKRLEKKYVIKYVKKLTVNQFKWIEDACPFNEDFTESYNEESDEEYFIKVDILSNLIMTYHVYQKEWNLKSRKAFY